MPATTGRVGRPRQTHCKRGHALVPANLRVRAHGPYFKRDCLACARAGAQAKHRRQRQRERVERVMLARGCDRVTAAALIAAGLDLRRDNAARRRALRHSPLALEQPDAR